VYEFTNLRIFTQTGTRTSTITEGSHREIGLGFTRVAEFRDFFFEICGMVAKCRNSREICPSACEICLVSVTFMPDIFIHRSPGWSPVRREEFQTHRPDPRSSATHCPFDCCPPMMRASSLRIQSMRSDALSLCGDECGDCALLLRRARGLGICVCCVA